MRVKLNKKVEERGIEAELSIEFLDCGDGTMRLLQCHVGYGTYSCDFVFVAETTTLADVIKELLDYCE